MHELSRYLFVAGAIPFVLLGLGTRSRRRFT